MSKNSDFKCPHDGSRIPPSSDNNITLERIGWHTSAMCQPVQIVQCDKYPLGKITEVMRDAMAAHQLDIRKIMAVYPQQPETVAHIVADWKHQHEHHDEVAPLEGTYTTDVLTGRVRITTPAKLSPGERIRQRQKQHDAATLPVRVTAIRSGKQAVYEYAVRLDGTGERTIRTGTSDQVQAGLKGVGYIEHVNRLLGWYDTASGAFISAANRRANDAYAGNAGVRCHKHDVLAVPFAYRGGQSWYCRRGKHRIGVWKGKGK